MQRTILVRSLAAVLALCALGALAQEPAPTLQPDAITLIKQVSENQKQLELLTRNYICTKQETIEKLDKSGNVKDTERKEYEVFFVQNEMVNRLIAKNGVPLKDDDKRREEDRVQNAIKRIREREAKRDRGDEERVEISGVLATQNFTNPRKLLVDGREVISFDFMPNLAYKPRNKTEKLAQKLAGTIQIEEAALQVVRVEARLLEPYRFGGGILGSVKEGTMFIIEQHKVNDEVWLPSFIQADIFARIVIAGLRERITDRYSAYRKFRVDAVIKPAD